ncbi:Holliday junction resolvase RuvX [Acidihalobacter prosperus]|uniref:Putative pre-16S rRNA nuclease n=1 Tax=Acidihalobacter prosperus TaxID=160660 RepID=A0A1A6C0P6_9GAMM|nr:Holliday junction resolvase RuvX [Acidihalobacter prosperus]OBS08137.1 hypothetical protein Thpro_022387 [Acidihalobacter prosperus]
MSFDYGTRRTGVAVGQRITGTARPLTTLGMPGGQPDWPAIDRLMRDWAPSDVVVGRPTRMDGSVTPLTTAAEGFAAALGRRYDLPVSLIDERLSSREAETELRRQRGDGSRGPIRKPDIDQEAAAVLLRDYLASIPLPSAPNRSETP